MTMTRSEKSKHLEVLSGRRTVQLAHPRLRAAAKAEGRSMNLTPAEYRELRMGRGQKTTEMAREQFARKSRYPRQVTRKG